MQIQGPHTGPGERGVTANETFEAVWIRMKANGVQSFRKGEPVDYYSTTAGALLGVEASRSTQGNNRVAGIAYEDAAAGQYFMVQCYGIIVADTDGSVNAGNAVQAAGDVTNRDVEQANTVQIGTVAGAVSTATGNGVVSIIGAAIEADSAQPNGRQGAKILVKCM